MNLETIKEIRNMDDFNGLSTGQKIKIKDKEGIYAGMRELTGVISGKEYPVFIQIKKEGEKSDIGETGDIIENGIFLLELYFTRPIRQGNKNYEEYKSIMEEVA